MMALVYNGINTKENNINKTKLILDSGASEHYTYNLITSLYYKYNVH